MSFSIYSQEITLPFQPSSEKKIISFGFNKLVNTYSFFNDAELFFPATFGNFYLKHNYTGNANIIQFENSIDVPFRDDERFILEYTLPINQLFSILVATNWLLSADSKTIGINKLERFNSGAGLRFNLFNNSMIDLKTGYEKNNQIGIISNSPFINLRSSLNNLDYDGYITNAVIYGEYAKLNYNRNNGFLYFNSKLNKNYDEDNHINLILNYKLQSLNDLAYMQGQKFNDFNVENRLENNLNASLDINFKIAQFPVELKFSYNEMLSDKKYQAFLPEKSITGIIRKRNLQELAFIASTTYILNSFNFRFGLAFQQTNDKYSISNSSNIPPIEELNWKNSESQRNFIEATTRLFTGFIWNLSSLDTLNINFSVSLLRRDTPSELNDNDRDIFNLLTDVSYTHKFSPLLYSNITFGTYHTHIVNLKSKKSAGNNWVRIFRLSPKISFNTTKFIMNPQFEVLAIYTIYDFEHILSGTSGNSKRQINYRDSIQFVFSKNFSLNTYLFFRYYEYGILFWDNFAESPESGNFEQFNKAIFYYKFNDKFLCGIGARYYKLKEKYLLTMYTDPVKNDNSSISPEINFKIKFDNSSELYLEGWYEFQNLKGLGKREIPNIFLSTTIWF
jgi:hypothetical protein